MPGSGERDCETEADCLSVVPQADLALAALYQVHARGLLAGHRADAGTG